MRTRHAGTPMVIYSDLLEQRSEGRTQFIDITSWVTGSLRRSGIQRGLVQIQVLHTTAAILINENEPLLLEDFKSLLDRFAPGNGTYAHDDMERRRDHAGPAERANGHAHARALLIGPTKTLNVHEGRVVLGEWQSVFLVELDGPRDRTIALTILGHEQPA